MASICLFQVLLSKDLFLEKFLSTVVRFVGIFKPTSTAGIVLDFILHFSCQYNYYIPLLCYVNSFIYFRMCLHLIRKP